MSVLEFLKNIGGVTVPDEVIRQANKVAERVEGILSLSRLPDGRILMSFAPTGEDTQGNSRPLLAKDPSHAESDLVEIFGFSPSKARDRIKELEERGETDAVVTVDGALASELFLYRRL